ncbi:MAG: glycine/betaine ABC transporter permease, partial [Gammaproteobacteria bacterium]
MAEEKAFDPLDPFKSVDLGIADWADGIKAWASANRDTVQPVKWFVNDLIVRVEGAMQATSPTIMLIIITLLAWQASGRRVAITVAACLLMLGLTDPRAWSLSMTTLAVVITSVLFCVA